MIASANNKNFIVAHYEWLALGVAVATLIAAVIYAVGAFGEDPDEASTDVVARFRRPASQNGDVGVKPVDLSDYERTSALLDPKKVPHVSDISTKDGSFLASAARVFCEHCRRPMPFRAEICPFCKQAPKVKELPVVVVDADGDGMTDEWEKEYGLNPADAADAVLDKDGDGFTNLEEFMAKTDPTNRNDHPDYLDSLSIVLPLVETKLPFVFEKVLKIPAGYRFYFKDPLAKNDYGQRGLQYAPVAGEDIGKTGYVVVSYNEKFEKRKIKSVGSEKALEKTVDVSTATIERKSDKRRFDLLVGNRKHIAVDVQAKLMYSRGEIKEMKVIAGDTIDLNGSKYEVKSVERVGNGAKVTLADKILGKIRVLEALEQ